MSPESPLRADATPFYQEYETLIESWTQLQEAMNWLADCYPAERIVWRGQSDSTWGLTSALYRLVAEQLLHLPTEEDVVQAERRLLALARTEWRLDGIPALQLFARMQHVGVPTRLLDATWNPLIAAWFAVAAAKQTDDVDARLFAFIVKSRIQLNSKWNTNTPRWHPNARFPRPAEWGTGLGRRVWQPPSLHTRIPAQSGVFLLDGVPVDGAPSDPDEASTWTARELREVTSIPVRFARIRPASRPMSKGLVFTYRITAAAKRDIREQLEKRFGYSFSTIYADVEGLAQYLHQSPDRLVRGQIDTRR